ncbi:MAG: SPOR domain-containing protein [Betaproteobacteria bacterium]|nr:SPOR domain-containing protein [Betaproteobacteria bacterium]
MRLAVFLLLLANALLFAYARLDRASVSEPGRLAGQIQPDSIKLLTPQQVAALGLDRSPIAAPAQAQAQAQAQGTGSAPPPVASPSSSHSQAAAPAQGAAQTSTQASAQPSTPDVCTQWGPFSDADRAKALADLEALKLGRQLSQHQVTVTDAWWVSLGPMPTRAAADRRVAELRALSIDDLSVVDSGNGQFAVSLGIFRTQNAATARVQALAARGIAEAHAAPRQQAITQTMLVVRNPSPVVAAKLEELQGKYAGSELRSGACMP